MLLFFVKCENNFIYLDLGKDYSGYLIFPFPHLAYYVRYGRVQKGKKDRKRKLRGK